MPVAVTNVQNLQELEVGVSGPENESRMFLVAGTANAQLFAYAQVNQSAQQKETFTLNVGPEMTSAQFVRGLVVASPAQMQYSQFADPPNSSVQWAVGFADADFDDDAKRAQIRFEVSLNVQSASASITQVAFQATIIATD